MPKISTAALQGGEKVLTTPPLEETDFGLPVVAPWHRKRTPSVLREVKSAIHARGGMVVWFTDGTKSTPLHGRTAWQSPDEPEGDTLW